MIGRRVGDTGQPAARAPRNSEDLHLAIAITCQVLFTALVHKWLSATRIKDLLARWEELDRPSWGPNTPLSDLPPPPPPPPRGDHTIKNPKEREIDPVVTFVLALVVLSAIDVFIRWAKLLALRVLPTPWRFPDSITTCHRPVYSEGLHFLEEDRREWDGPMAAMFQKQQGRRLSFGRRATQSIGTAAQPSGHANTTSIAHPGHVNQIHSEISFLLPCFFAMA
ncbi:hypothetical protein FMUND_638 [Fusarium mundagurra]|uniref:Uncharacterized protein n=1 Tax=Fusarium mundagurra TaxID=1567541 RepID=A0A8H5Z4E4_9HYPO|nr:hypothetical protein FMUND_638 [Fusarium mundagurra]